LAATVPPGTIAPKEELSATVETDCGVNDIVDALAAPAETDRARTMTSVAARIVSSLVVH
jgi:hypothetical protein